MCTLGIYCIIEKTRLCHNNTLHSVSSRRKSSSMLNTRPPHRPRRHLTGTLPRRSLTSQRHASRRVLEGELINLAARGSIRVVVRELLAPLDDSESGEGRVVLPTGVEAALEGATVAVDGKCDGVVRETPTCGRLAQGLCLSHPHLCDRLLLVRRGRGRGGGRG